MAVAARQGQLGAVCLRGGDLLYWERSREYAKSNDRAEIFAANLISEFEPDIFVTEDPTFARRKHPSTKSLLSALAKAAQNDVERVVALERKQYFANMLEEAKDIAMRHPVLADYVPNQPFYEKEAREFVLFEAMELAEEARDLLTND